MRHRRRPLEELGAPAVEDPLKQPGAMTFFSALPQERVRKQNHWFDCLYNASAAGNYCGVRLVDEVRLPPQRRPTLRELAGAM